MSKDVKKYSHAVTRMRAYLEKIAEHYMIVDKEQEVDDANPEPSPAEEELVRLNIVASELDDIENKIEGFLVSSPDLTKKSAVETEEFSNKIEETLETIRAELDDLRPTKIVK
jgi:predicted  nucleic acid-binding Zn-ribbon protein